MSGEGVISASRAMLVVSGLKSGGLEATFGSHTTATASDAVVTGLAEVYFAVGTLEADPVAGCDRVQVVVGDQAGAPAKGAILIKTFKPTSATDTAPVAASTFSKKVNWLAWGRFR